MRKTRTTLPKGVFGAEEPEPPKAKDTQLGGTVPEIWAIPSPPWNDDDMTPLFERDSLAPAVSGKVLRYAIWLMQRYDKNGDGIIQHEEWKTMPGAPQAMDVDGDLQISMEELLRHLALYGQKRTIHRPNPPELSYLQPGMATSQFQLFKPFAPLPPPSAPETVSVSSPEKKGDGSKTGKSDKPADLTEDEMNETETHEVDDATYEEIAAGHQVAATKKFHTDPSALKGVPVWFLMRDQDGDGQISISEFAPTLSAPALALFGKLDKNGDGLITPDEVRPSTPQHQAPPAQETTIEPATAPSKPTEPATAPTVTDPKPAEPKPEEPTSTTPATPTQPDQAPAQ